MRGTQLIISNDNLLDLIKERYGGRAHAALSDVINRAQATILEMIDSYETELENIAKEFTWDIEIVLNNIKEYLGGSLDEMYSMSRTARVQNVRKVLISCYRDNGLGYREIAELTGRTDHSTMISAYNGHHALMQTDRRYRVVYDTMTRNARIYKNTKKI